MMHYISLALKRAHYAALATSRPFATKFGLTPARFDLICCALRLRMNGFQANIARSLGVSQVTISRMVRRMELTGLIRRERVYRDKKKWIIRLTKEGRRRFYLVLRRLQRRPLQRRFESVVRHVLYKEDDAMRIQLSGWIDVIRAAARRLGDVSTFHYPDWLWFLD